MEDLRVIFMGTPEFAVPALRSLIQAHHQVVAVYTQPPRPAGRGQKECPSPVHHYAGQHGLRVETPKTLKDAAAQQVLKDLHADVIVVSAYGLLLPKPVLEATRLGCINVHPSLLPRWRGAAPIQRTLMAGDDTTGVTMMLMNEGLDTGDMLTVKTCPILNTMSYGDLHDTLADMSGPLVIETLEGLASGAIKPKPQPEDGVVYANKITKEDAKIDWTKTATEIHNQIRGLSPHPGAYFVYKDEHIKILETRSEPNLSSGIEGSVLDHDFTIACGSGSISPTLLQRPGKKPMPVKDFLNGFRVKIGTVLE